MKTHSTASVLDRASCLNPLVHAASGTVYSTSGWMHKGINKTLSPVITRYFAIHFTMFKSRTICLLELVVRHCLAAGIKLSCQSKQAPPLK